MKLKVGDIFTIPIEENKISFGRIINLPNKSNLFIVIYDYISELNNIPKLTEIIKKEIIILGCTLDAKLYHKHWVIIGNCTDNILDIRLPIYKFGLSDSDMYITNYKGVVIRKASIDEFDILDYKYCRAPVGFESVLKAYYKNQHLEPDDEKLLYSNVLFKLSKVVL